MSIHDSKCNRSLKSINWLVFFRTQHADIIVWDHRVCVCVIMLAVVLYLSGLYM